MNKQKIIDYYEKSIFDYFLIWLNKENLAMHYGYWDEKVINHHESLLRLNEVIAEKLKLKKSDIVLDAGCGLGGTTFWLAKHIGCHVTGISITPDQIRRAKEYANEKNLDHLVSFEVGDYTNTHFPDNFFDAVIAIETICHLADKRPFFKEIHRVLKPGGKLLFADFTLLKEKFTSDEKQLIHKQLTGWMVPNIWKKEQYVSAMSKESFEGIQTENYSEKTILSSRRLYLWSLLGIPFFWLTSKLHILNSIHLGDAISCYYQWITKKKGLWGHLFFYGKK